MVKVVNFVHLGSDFIQAYRWCMINKDDKTCQSMLLHYCSSVLLEIYMKFNNSKHIWDAFERKYYCITKLLYEDG